MTALVLVAVALAVSMPPGVCHHRDPVCAQMHGRRLLGDKTGG